MGKVTGATLGAILLLLTASAALAADGPPESSADLVALKLKLAETEAALIEARAAQHQCSLLVLDGQYRAKQAEIAGLRKPDNTPPAGALGSDKR